MSIYQRFLALPRGRKGTTAVVIVEESVLAKLIYDATWKHPEVSDQFAAHLQAGRRENAVPHIDAPAGLPNAVIDEIHNANVRRNRWR